MPIKYKPIGFPDKIICVCGTEHELRDIILISDKRKIELESEIYSNYYFSGIPCSSNQDAIWYVLLDYKNDLREIILLTEEPISLDQDLENTNKLLSKTREIRKQLENNYLIDFEFPAAVFTTDYIRPHEVEHLKNKISYLLPLIVIRPEDAQVKTGVADIVLIIPYYSDGEIYGEIKVNYNLPAHEREWMKDLSFNLWDLLSDHYFGPLDQIDWDINSLLLE